MKKVVFCLVATALLATVAPPCLAGGHSHSGGQQAGGKKDDTTTPTPPQSASYDPAATNQVVARINGGAVRRVVANETSDARQIGLIRDNLRKQAEQFSTGSLPAPLPGRGVPLPGFAALQAAAPGQLHAEYLAVRAGAEVRYTSDDPALIMALRTWLDADAAVAASAASTAADSPPRRSP